MPTRYGLVVFDLDGTLVDSQRDLAESANELLSVYGASPIAHEAIVRMVGEGARVLVERVLAASGLAVPLDEALERFLTIYDRRLVDHTGCYPGIVHALEQLAPTVPLAVLTNKPLAPSRRILAHLGIDSYFIDVIGGDGPYGRKPAPEGLLALARLAASPIESVLMVGDSAVDWETARRAGAQMCVARYGFGLHTLDAAALNGTKLAVSRPEELLSVIGI